MSPIRKKLRYKDDLVRVASSDNLYYMQIQLDESHPPAKLIKAKPGDLKDFSSEIYMRTPTPRMLPPPPPPPRYHSSVGSRNRNNSASELDYPTSYPNSDYLSEAQNSESSPYPNGDCNSTSSYGSRHSNWQSPLNFNHGSGKSQSVPDLSHPPPSTPPCYIPPRNPGSDHGDASPIINSTSGLSRVMESPELWVQPESPYSGNVNFDTTYIANSKLTKEQQYFNSLESKEQESGLTPNMNIISVHDDLDNIPLPKENLEPENTTSSAQEISELAAKAHKMLQQNRKISFSLGPRRKSDYVLRVPNSSPSAATVCKADPSPYTETPTKELRRMGRHIAKKLSQPENRDPSSEATPPLALQDETSDFKSRHVSTPEPRRRSNEMPQTHLVTPPADSTTPAVLQSKSDTKSSVSPKLKPKSRWSMESAGSTDSKSNGLYVKSGAVDSRTWPRGLWKPSGNDYSLACSSRTSPSRWSTDESSDDQEWLTSYSSLYSSLSSPFIDSHCHLDFLFTRTHHLGSLSTYLSRGLPARTTPQNFAGCIAVFCDAPFWKLERRWTALLLEDKIWGAFGVHPKSADQWNAETERLLRKILKHKKVKALGEIGLDYSRGSMNTPEKQKEVFKAQLNIAVEVEMPLVIHCRDAEEDCLNIMKELVPRSHPIHRHCFTESWESACLWLGYFTNIMFGLTPLVTFPTAHTTHRFAANVPLENLLLETDSPYFIPRGVSRSVMPHSHPGMAITTAVEVAKIKRIPAEELLQQCYKNTVKMYKL